ncbi:MAG TPA: LuxR C-terminal-related transcriptional regulator [Jiangellaceae bacterium]
MAGESVSRTVKAAQPHADAWDAVYDRLSAVSLDSLPVTDLEALAEAAFWLGRPREAIAARQKAYAWHRDAGDATSAAKTAWLLFYNYFDLNETAAASGWLKRAHRHAEVVPEQVEPGYVALAEADWANYNGSLDRALEHAVLATETGHRFGDRDLEGLGLATQGRLLVTRGDIAAGLDRMDEAMVAVLGDELSTFVTGWVYCLLLATCQELGDLRRAAEWTDLAVRWGEERGQQSWYPGLCRLHQCEVQSWRGEWTVAEAQAIRAAEDLAPFGDYLIGEGQYVAGEIRRRRGEYKTAEDAFRRAHQHGRDPQPGLALLHLAQGDAERAAATLRIAVAAGDAMPLSQAQLLAAHVRAELACGGLDAAAESADRLARLAAQSGSRLLLAIAGRTTGEVLLSQGKAQEALTALKEACAIHRELSCPYETAETRVLVGLAARQLGDEATATLEFEAARAAFAMLGAAPDVAHVDALREHEPQLPAGLTAREAEVLRLVACGRSNRAIAAELFISEHTVARHLSNIFRKIDVTSRSAATSFAHEHNLV